MRAAAASFAPAALPAHGSGEFGIDTCDVERVRGLIHARAGISLHAGKQAIS